MNKRSRILFHMGLLTLNQKWLDKQISKNNVDALHFALVHGLYDIRLKAAEHLGTLREQASAPFLKAAIDDEVQLVSEAAMHALELIGCSAEIQSEIETKRRYWLTRSEQAKNKKPREKTYTPNRKERPSKKSFENLKNMLKKPMNTGKWF